MWNMLHWNGHSYNIVMYETGLGTHVQLCNLYYSNSAHNCETNTCDALKSSCMKYQGNWSGIHYFMCPAMVYPGCTSINRVETK